MKDFYTYELIDSRTNIPFYIGKGTGNRMYRHYYDVNNGKKFVNTKLENKIKSILKNEANIIYRKYVALTEQDAFDKEIELIKFYDLKNLCNLTNGGEGISGFRFKMTDESKKKISVALKDKPKSEEHKNKLRDSKLIKPTRYWENKTFTEEHKEKLSESAKGKILSEETKEKISLNSKSYLTKGKTKEEIYGIEKALEIKQLNRIAQLNKTFSKDVNISKGRKGSTHNRAKTYIINDNENITEELTTQLLLSEKYKIKLCTIRSMILTGKILNNFSISLK